MPKAWELPQPTRAWGGRRGRAKLQPLKEAGVTSGAGFHHSEIMLWALVRGKEVGRKGGKAERVAAGLGEVPGLKEKAAGTSGG